MSEFARHFRRSPERLGPEDIRAYQHHLVHERKLSASSLFVAVAALRFLYKVTLTKDWPIATIIPTPKRQTKLPVVLSPDEVSRLLEAVPIYRHRVILTTCYAAGLRVSDPAASAQHLARARAVEWIVYAKRPFAGPRQVLDYVGRYTHRVAISNNRLVTLEDDQVRFRWKDYRAESEVKTMTLAATEFLRRFLLHVLPAGFQRIRYYRLLGNRHRAEKLARCRGLLGMTPPSSERSAASGTGDYRDRLEALTGVSLRICPMCHEGQMIAINRGRRLMGGAGRREHLMTSHRVLAVSPVRRPLRRHHGTRVAGPRRHERPRSLSASSPLAAGSRIGSHRTTDSTPRPSSRRTRTPDLHSMPIGGASG